MRKSQMKTRMLIFSSLACLLLTGCNRHLEVAKIVSIEPRLQSYVSNFVQEGANVGSSIIIDNLIVRFTNKLDASTLGECWDYHDGTEGNPTIYINYNDWLTQTETRRKVVMFHELGHCVLWRGHNETYTNGIPTSIMYPYIGSDSDYLNNWAYYMQELFHGH